MVYTFKLFNLKVDQYLLKSVILHYINLPLTQTVGAYNSKDSTGRVCKSEVL